MCFGLAYILMFKSNLFDLSMKQNHSFLKLFQNTILKYELFKLRNVIFCPEVFFFKPIFYGSSWNPFLINITLSPFTITAQCPFCRSIIVRFIRFNSSYFKPHELLIFVIFNWNHKNYLYFVVSVNVSIGQEENIIKLFETL